MKMTPRKSLLPMMNVQSKIKPCSAQDVTENPKLSMNGFKKDQYLARINPTKYTDKCPKFKIFPHSTPHLFNCPDDPTDLSTRSLWDDPVEAAKFLGLDVD